MKRLIAAIQADCHLLHRSLNPKTAGAHRIITAGLYDKFLYFPIKILRKRTLIACTCGLIFYRREDNEIDKNLNEQAEELWIKKDN